MENQTLAEVKSIQSDMASLSVAETNNIKEKHTKTCEDDFENYKYKRNMLIDGKFEVPDDFLVEKIVQQVEFLLSDANVVKDKFLLKHLRRNKEGYISLKLVSSLRKVKALSKDWRVIAYSLKKSRKLQMNDEMTKIKRVHPLPIIEVLDSSRTVLVFIVPAVCWTLENVKKDLIKFGTVTSIFTVKSLPDLMSINVRKTLDIYKDIVAFPFLVVQFETSDEAANAVLQTVYPASIFRIVSLIEEDILISKSTPVISLSCSNERFSMQNDTTNIVDDNISLTPLKSDLDPFNLKTYYENNDLVSTPMTLKQDDKPNKTKKCRFHEKDNFSHGKGVSFPPCAYRGDGLANNGWTQRRHFIGLQKESRVIALRQPKGPDGTKGFRKLRLRASLSPVF